MKAEDLFGVGVLLHVGEIEVEPGEKGLRLRRPAGAIEDGGQQELVLTTLPGGARLRLGSAAREQSTESALRSRVLESGGRLRGTSQTMEGEGPSEAGGRLPFRRKGGLGGGQERPVGLAVAL